MEKKSQTIVPMINKQDRFKNHYTETTHHILPTSMGGNNKKCNKIKLYKPLHESFHRVFGNTDIKGQIRQLIKINESALNPLFLRKLKSLIASNDMDYYYKYESYRK